MRAANRRVGIKKSRHALYLLVLIFASSSNVVAQPELEAEEWNATLTLDNINLRMQAMSRIETTAKRIRCVILVLHQGMLSEQVYNNTTVRRMSIEENCALTLMSLTNVEFGKTGSPTSDQFNRDSSRGGGETVKTVMRQLGELSGHREMEDAPILLWGFSASASFGATFAAQYPERTIGFIRYHTHRRGLSLDIRRVREVPALIVAGGMDQTAGVEDAEQLWRLGRAEGAPWTLAVEPEAQHASPEVHASTLKELTIPWIRAVLHQRLAETGGLARVSSDKSWLGDFQSLDIASSAEGAGDKSWLPDESSARGWRAVMRRSER